MNRGRIDVLKSWLERLWQCKIWRFHEWTCDAAEGIKPTPEQVAGGVDGFYDYAKMYCKRCGKVSDLYYRLKKVQNG